MPICLPDAPCHVRRERSTADASSAAQTSSACCSRAGAVQGDHRPRPRASGEIPPHYSTRGLAWPRVTYATCQTRRRPRMASPPAPAAPGRRAPAAARWRGGRQAQGPRRVGSRGGSRGPAARDETRERDQTQTRARSSAERPRARPGRRRQRNSARATSSASRRAGRSRRSRAASSADARPRREARRRTFFFTLHQK